MQIILLKMTSKLNLMRKTEIFTLKTQKICPEFLIYIFKTQITTLFKIAREITKLVLKLP